MHNRKQVGFLSTYDNSGVTIVDIMRFKKGSKVEVFCKDEVPSGSWRSAEVISGNGHNYTVKYDMGAEDHVIFEKVSGKLIRPFPPLVTIPECWVSGDVVEVLQGYSWKMATVFKVLRGNHLLVRLVGALNEFKVHKFNIRPRQSWIDGRWILVGKGSGDFDDKKCNELPLSNYEEKDYIGVGNNFNFQESHLVFRKSLKRGWHSQNLYPQSVEQESTKKFRADENAVDVND